MGAIRNVQPRPSSLRKPAVPETAKASRLDQYGRDPESPSEQLRGQSDYEKDAGYAPFFHEWLADLPRLLGGSAVGYALCLNIVRLSAGRGFDPKSSPKQRFSFTTPISLDDLSNLCRCDLRQLQRQIAELSERGVIESKSLARGLYSFSLCFREWRGLDDYAVWKRKQAVPITKGREEEETPEDESILEVSRDAVHLTKKPQTARPGRALREIKIDVGVRKLRCENASSAANVAFESRVEPGGTIVVSATIGAALTVEEPRKAEVKPPSSPANHPRASEVLAIFTPLLQQSGARLLSYDSMSLLRACDAMGAMPATELRAWMDAGEEPRSSRPISSPKHVAAIITEARESWEGGGLMSRPRKKPEVKSSSDSLLDYAKGRLDRDGTI